jgi:hypothetical protein
MSMTLLRCTGRGSRSRRCWRGSGGGLEESRRALLCGCANPGRAARAQCGILRPQARVKPLFGAKLTYCTRYDAAKDNAEVIVTLAPYQR